ncbi:MAG: cytochrome c biogenesis protein CcmG/thiol:disulfide interchange protein DsbE [Chitinophagales bacterium]|jgi:cytochrome c biogenesis protein CcmG/thiol:disulfide interchange protein DsbE
MARLKLFIPLFIFALLAALLYSGLDGDPSELPTALAGKPVPAFELTALQGSRILTEKDLVGEVSLLNVWATWCISCRAEHPTFMRIAEEIPIYGLNYKDDNAKAKKWLQELGDPYRLNIVDSKGSLGLDLGVYGAPETYVLDRHGIIRHKRVGVVDDSIWLEEILPIVNKLRAEG